MRGGEFSVIYFLYSTTPLISGKISYEIRSPAFEVRLSLARGQAGPLRLERFNAKPLGTQGNPTGDLPQESIDAAADALLRAVADGKLNADDGRTIHETYRLWQEQNPVIAKQISARCPKFFTWLHDPHD